MTTTQLPEPNFIERDAEAITQEWINYYQEKTGKTLQPAQVERILIDLGAYRENLLRIKIQETAKQNLLNYAPMEVLEHLGELVGVDKLDAVPSVTTLKFYIDEVYVSDLIVPKGTEVETEDGKYTFVTSENCVIKQGTLYATVEAKCSVGGSGSNNYAIGKINSLLTPIDIVENVTNTVVSYGGGDEESVESLRERIRLAPESFSNAGSKGAYRFHTLSAHSSITDVTVISPTAGTVEIYPLTATGNPDSGLLQIISAYLNQDYIRPLTDNVVVKAPQKIDFNVNAVLTLYLNADVTAVQKLVNEGLTAYKKELAAQLGKDIVPTQIIAILNSIYGVYKVELISPAFQKLERHQWANLANINVTIGGQADE